MQIIQQDFNVHFLGEVDPRFTWGELKGGGGGLKG